MSIIMEAIFEVYLKGKKSKCDKCGKEIIYNTLADVHWEELHDERIECCPDCGVEGRLIVIE
jgi:predicted  nucleic acid-binding Zn ribbon protein